MWVELTMCPFVPSDTELTLIFQLIVREASVTRSLSIRQSLTYLCSSFFYKFFLVSHHLVHRQYIHRWRECTQWKRSQIDYKHSTYILNIEIQVYSMSARTYSELTRCMTSLYRKNIFFYNILFASVTSSSLVRTKTIFPSRHPILSVVLVRLSRLLSKGHLSKDSLEDSLVPGMGNDAVSQSFSVFHSVIYRQTVDFFPP